MPHYHQIKTLPYPAKDLFAMVMDVESYPKFLPWCGGARVISIGEEVIAELVIQYKGFTEKYRSKIIAREDNTGYEIYVEAISGPFSMLKNLWKFTKLDANSTNIEFNIDFKFKSMLFERLIGMFFTSVAEKMVDAFEKRAQEIYEYKNKIAAK